LIASIVRYTAGEFVTRAMSAAKMRLSVNCGRIYTRARRNTDRKHWAGAAFDARNAVLKREKSGANGTGCAVLNLHQISAPNVVTLRDLSRVPFAVAIGTASVLMSPCAHRTKDQHTFK
jgi:hypothetical protein